VINDRTGPIEQNSAMATFAYNFALNRQGLRLSLGLSPGFKQFSFNPDGFTENLLTPDDPTITQIENAYLFQVAAGAWLYNEHFFLGGSSFQLINSLINGAANQLNTLSSTAFVRHYYFMGGLNINLGEQVFFVPSVLLKTLDDAAISYDITGKLVFNNQFWLGANIRKEDAIGGFVGILINDRMELHFSYDLVTSSIRNAAAGSIEIHLGYRIFNQNSVVCPDRFW
ncbi:MAG: PorP/SprF family type IX secretion system membrane protein, partial [Bacteroidota bacterium]